MESKKYTLAASQGEAAGKPAGRKRSSKYEPKSKIPTTLSLDLSLLEYAQQMDTAAYVWYRDRGAIDSAHVMRWRAWFVFQLVRMEKHWPGSYREWSRRNRVILPFGTLDKASEIISTLQKGGMPI